MPWWGWLIIPAAAFGALALTFAFKFLAGFVKNFVRSLRGR